MDNLLPTQSSKRTKEVNIPAFKDVKSPSEFRGSTPLNPFRPGGQESIQIGTGFTVYNVDQSGMWLGAPRFSEAPFSVTMAGEAVIKRLLNQNGEIVADELGLNSVNLFTQGETRQTNDQVFVGNTFVEASNLVLTVLNLQRPVIALVYVSVAGYHTDVDGRLEFQLFINDLPQGEVFVLNRVAAASTVQTAYITVPVRLETGNNTILIKGRSNNLNSGVMNCSVIPAVLGYLLLGK